MFDHGLIKNLMKYGSINPPSYNLSAITAPVFLYYGNNDWMANIEDVFKLSRKLGNVVEIHKVPLEKFNNLDFTYGRNVDKVLYWGIIENIKKWN